MQLPRWLTLAVGGMLGVGPEDGLKPVCGAQGLLIQSLGERSEDVVVAVLFYESPALGACAGTFRFVASGARQTSSATSAQTFSLCLCLWGYIANNGGEHRVHVC